MWFIYSVLFLLYSKVNQLYIHVSTFFYVLFLCMLLFSCQVVPDSATPWTVAHPAPLSMGFPRQGYWSGLPFPPPTFFFHFVSTTFSTSPRKNAQEVNFLRHHLKVSLICFLSGVKVLTGYRIAVGM